MNESIVEVFPSGEHVYLCVWLGRGCKDVYLHRRGICAGWRCVECERFDIEVGTQVVVDSLYLWCKLRH